MNRAEFMDRIVNEGIGRSVYKEKIGVLMIGPYDLEKKGDKWVIIENIERKGEVVVYETVDEGDALDTLFVMAKRKKETRI